jgi:peptidylprolyl isomerase/FKBP-type peptidyl-prolyl cis-trans isomerase SlpA
VDRNLFSEDVTPAIGKQLQIKVQGGNDVTATITDVTPESVTVDANHPLAGRTLSFSILLVDIC